jgi:hypothetical protein
MMCGTEKLVVFADGLIVNAGTRAMLATSGRIGALDAEDLPFRNWGRRLLISLRLQAQIFDRTAETRCHFFGSWCSCPAGGSSCGSASSESSTL